MPGHRFGSRRALSTPLLVDVLPVFQAPDEVGVLTLERLRGRRDGEPHLPDRRVEVPLRDRNACRVVVPDPTIRVLLNVDAEEFQRFILPALNLEPPAVAVDLELAAFGNRFIARGERLLPAPERAQGVRLGHLILEAVFDLDGAIRVLQRLLRAEPVVQQVVGRLLPRLPLELGAGAELVAQEGDMYVYFNNDWEGFAVRNGLRLKELVAA